MSEEKKEYPLVTCAVCPRFSTDPPRISCWAVENGQGGLFPICDPCKKSLEKAAKDWGISIGSVASALFVLPVDEIREYYSKSLEFAMEEATQPIDLGRFSNN